jgi:hypothetical protein
VFRIRDILKRILIVGSEHLITDPDLDPGPALAPSLFVSGFQKTNKIYVLFFKFFFLITYCRNIYISLQR